MVYGAVIPAAGMSTRMKSFKQLMKIGDLGLLERVVTSLKRCGISNIVVVTGYRADEVMHQLRDLGTAFVHNPDYETTQMFDSIKLGLLYLQGTCEKVYLCPADVPLFLPDTALQLAEAEGEVIIPTVNGKEGHPVLVQADLISRILQCDGSRGLRGTFDQMQIEPVHLEVEDPCCVMDTDTPEDFQKLAEIYQASLLHSHIDIQLVRKDVFFDPDTVILMQAVESLKSVRAASETVGISYSKAWTILKRAEKELGYQLVERRQGGRNGGMAMLTERGKLLLDSYQRYLQAVSRYAEIQFPNYFDSRIV